MKTSYDYTVYKEDGEITVEGDLLLMQDEMAVLYFTEEDLVNMLEKLRSKK